MSMSGSDTEDDILYKKVKKVKAGEVERFQINYCPPVNDHSDTLRLPQNLWVKVKNKKLIALRAAYIAGPYVLYVDCYSEDYDQNKKSFVTANQPTFEPQLLPGQSFYTELACHTIKEKYSWTVNVVSQIIFNNNADVEFEISVGTSKKSLQKAHNGETSRDHQSYIPPTLFNVQNYDTWDLWNLPLPKANEPIHLVILSHGLHSNAGADMLYLKEQIDSASHTENIVVKGFLGNVGRTERGIKFLGTRVAKYIIELMSNNEVLNNGKVKKISFIGHSLGGLVQCFAIAYLQSNYPWFFDVIRPINFITIASPMLGVINENPSYVRFALQAGIVGKSGHDLSLKFLDDGRKPLLLLLPTGPTHKILKRFLRRTVYANVANDGIVPLRTSSLLFLDYRAITKNIGGADSSFSKDEEGTKVKKVPYGADRGPNYDIGSGNRNSLLSVPMQAALSYFAPQKERKPSSRYQKYQTTTTEGNSQAKVLENCEGEEVTPTHKIPRASFIEVATTLLLPPLPPINYIVDPETRPNAIVHDEYYRDCDLPPKKNSNEAGLSDLNVLNTNSKGEATSIENPSKPTKNKKIFSSKNQSHDLEEIEEQIAREYHRGMVWRKVIVKLKPDAHNNIIVRRRFSNAYGWPVIDHLVREHFENGEPVKGKRSSTTCDCRETEDSLDKEVELTDLVTRYNDNSDLYNTSNISDYGAGDGDGEVDLLSPESLKSDLSWLNTCEDSNSLLALGPTGLLSEFMGSLKDLWNDYNSQGWTNTR